MTGTEIRHTEHSRLVNAAPRQVYELVADVRRWPAMLAPCVFARRLEHTGDTERIEIWARTNGEIKSWTSRRELDPIRLRVGFAQDRSAPPIAAMSGTWSFHAEGAKQTRMVLSHSFSADKPGTAALDWITEAVDRNSEQELAALAAIAELGFPVDRLVFSFGERVELPDVSAAAAYEFIYRCDLWPDRLPHVGRVTLREEPDGVQEMEMDTVTADGGTHTTSSVRLCFPDTKIVYKQTVLPALLTGHSGSWEFQEIEGGSAITSLHTVALNPTALADVLGVGTTLDKARAHVRKMLKANSRATMEAARGYAETAVRRS